MKARISPGATSATYIITTAISIIVTPLPAVWRSPIAQCCPPRGKSATKDFKTVGRGGCFLPPGRGCIATQSRSYLCEVLCNLLSIQLFISVTTIQTGLYQASPFLSTTNDGTKTHAYGAIFFHRNKSFLDSAVRVHGTVLGGSSELSRLSQLVHKSDVTERQNHQRHDNGDREVRPDVHCS